MTGRTLNWYWKVIWAGVSPLLIVSLFVFYLTDYILTGTLKYQAWDASQVPSVSGPPGARSRAPAFSFLKPKNHFPGVGRLFVSTRKHHPGIYSAQDSSKWALSFPTCALGKRAGTSQGTCAGGQEKASCWDWFPPGQHPLPRPQAL